MTIITDCMPDGSLESVQEVLDRHFEEDSPPDPLEHISVHEPYEDHRQTQPDLPIWKYTKLEHFETLVGREQLYFASPTIYPDPFERYYPHYLGDADETGEIGETIAKYIVNNIYLSCWHQNRHESMGMWDLYTDDGTGVVIKSTYLNLKESLIGPRESTINDFAEALFFGKVMYGWRNTTDPFKDREQERKIPLPSERLHPFFHKRQGYGHENEIRAVLDLTRVTDRTPDSDPENNGHFVDVNVDRLIDKVVVAPDADEELFNDAKDIMTLNNHNEDLVGKFELDETQLENIIDI